MSKIAFSTIPFAFDRDGQVGLSEQMANGLRLAIVSGKFKPGDVLPTIREWAKLLGASIRVPTSAMRALAREGLVVTRPRHGCVVLAKRIPWRGNVLVVTPEGDNVYVAAVMTGRLIRRLEESGYCVSRLAMPVDAEEKRWLARLELALRQSVALAVFIRHSPGIDAVARRSGVPFVQVGHVRSRLPSCVCYVALDYLSRASDFVSACKSRGIETFHWVSHRKFAWDPLLDRLRKAGIKVRRRLLRVDWSKRPPECVTRAALDGFLAHPPSASSSDLYFFSDDFFAQGALLAMALSGLRVPEDVRVATLSNYGLGPVFPKELSRFEVNAYRNGDEIAAVALHYLERGVCPPSAALTGTWIPGETL